MYIIYKQLVFLTDVLQKFNKNYYNNIVNKVQVAKNNLDQALKTIFKEPKRCRMCSN